MFKKENLITSIVVFIALILGILILSITWVRVIIALLIFLAIGVLGIIWTFHALGSDNYGAIKRILYFLLRAMLMLSYCYGLYLIIKILFK